MILRYRFVMLSYIILSVNIQKICLAGVGYHITMQTPDRENGTHLRDQSITGFIVLFLQQSWRPCY